ncbi:unnamed protein product [Parascedosporium putredinis]|uniref:Arf-GAP domain-containing protein n=1 Tax=Parascedosporium putredinis TaxID=1442378 RepID=A0A9P1GV99_9PEZI|nr:unnamed protein product [Parascedosporium putredinis]CAI7987758.1 unnamed protein product [Parascedosporium putredinis]
MATSKAMWEVDPETRSKLKRSKRGQEQCLLRLRRSSPQWASPKFGVFICLSCAGVHRGLGVHISFVRSISMDAFKPNEIERMRLGGNQGWRDFFEAHEDTTMMGLTWDEATIAERYSGTVGEEWKERLTAKVEEREYERYPSIGEARRVQHAPAGGQATASGGKVKVDDKFFAKLGADNAGRRDDLPPSQGGKYAGFGSTPHPSTANPGAGGAAPSLDELQKDPLGALTKGFGWFASTVTKTAKDVNEGYIQPTAQKIAESDLAKQAQVTAAQVARQAQQGARTANDGFLPAAGVQLHRHGGDGQGGRTGAGPAKKKDDDWDEW